MACSAPSSTTSSTTGSPGTSGPEWSTPSGACSESTPQSLLSSPRSPMLAYVDTTLGTFFLRHGSDIGSPLLRSLSASSSPGAQPPPGHTLPSPLSTLVRSAEYSSSASCGSEPSLSRIDMSLGSFTRRFAHEIGSPLYCSPSAAVSPRPEGSEAARAHASLGPNGPNRPGRAAGWSIAADLSELCGCAGSKRFTRNLSAGGLDSAIAGLCKAGLEEREAASADR